MTDWRFLLVVAALCVFEAFSHNYIIHHVPYTEIDWSTYMQQVNHFLAGQRNYVLIKGDTGPLVYPAGFLYVFSILSWLTQGGRDLVTAQYIFGGLYFLTLLLVLDIYWLIKLPKRYFPLLVLSKRIHSIYLLRLFNDPFAVFFSLLSVWFTLRNKSIMATLALSAGISIKMNCLLYIPGHLWIILLQSGNGHLLWKHVSLIIGFQLIMAWPFIQHYPIEYFSRAFNFGKTFEYQWTVNWKCVPEWIFDSSQFSLCLLACHLSFLTYFLLRKHIKLSFFLRILKSTLFFRNMRLIEFSKVDKLHILFGVNFIGVIFSRSLHYQFYTWYFYSLPYLLFRFEKWISPLVISLNFDKCFTLTSRSFSFVSFTLAVSIWLVVELCWNIFPSTLLSSFLLNCSNLVLLIAILIS